MLELKYVEVCDRIESDVAANKWKDRLPGVHLLAKHYGVAQPTASKAVKLLAKRGKVTIDGTRGTFISKKDKIRPRYNKIAIVGVVHKQNKSMEFQEIETLASAEKMKIVTIGRTEDWSDSDTEFYAQLPVDGFIFAYSTLKKSIAVELRTKGIPFVSFNATPDIPGLDYVDFDNFSILKQSLDTLLQMGHQRIACIGFHFTSHLYEEKIKAIYQASLEKYDVEKKQLWHFTADEIDYWKKYGDDYFDIYAKESIEKLMEFKKPPTAAIFFKESMALAVCSWLSQKGYKLPSEFPIITDSRDSILPKGSPLFGKKYLPATLQARMSMEILLDIIKNEKTDRKPKQILLPRKLIFQNI